ncbi:C-terminal processing protease CtpA/Prc, contains a PDZ domain [Reichenbachiella faecimaris]|uniref:Tricorn protease homolog n=1 Tax=Reichenbachiella faecimaris TaxID=692418 RepID=A0A1W2G964_REIFA|nr:S41 family peptidase [Reichenbachiella faecimaris]SMD32982.1 C-terminal processing protease CtpA/Prc, contains a PDZ domain [Reichenbachiella faecimaris]
MQRLTLTIFAWAMAFSSFAQITNPLINFPTLSPDGNTIAFAYQGDIWTADANGSNPRRLTIHEGYETNPLWTPDGQGLVFRSDRNGNNDVYVINLTGGLPKQLTFHSSSDSPSDVTKDGKVLFHGNRNYRQIEWDNEVQMVNLSGGTPYRYLNALGFYATQSPNGRFVAFVKGSCRDEREAYNGPANTDIWLYDSQNNAYSQLTTDTHNDIYPKWGNDQTLFIQSARSGRYNVHQISLDANGAKSGDIQAITLFTDMGISSFSVGNRGQTILLNKGDQLISVNVATKQTSDINLTIGSDYRFDPIERKSYSKDVDQIIPSPSGKYSALVIRGEIFITENDKEKSRTINLSNSPYRDLEPQWVNDSTLVFISDRGGNYDIYAVRSADSKEGDLFKTLKLDVSKITSTTEEESGLVISPDFKTLVFMRGGGQLLTASISSKGFISNEKTLLNGWAQPYGLSWSPDSKWLAYSMEDLNFNEEIFILKADGSKSPVNISMHPKLDSDPTWSPDGSKLVFTSARSNGDYDIWYLWLKKSDWEKTADEWKYEDEVVEKPKSEPESSKKKKNAKSDDKKEDDGIAPIQIDFEDIHERLEQVTSFYGNEINPLVSKDGKTIYYRTSSDGWGKPAKVDIDLYKISWDKKDHTAITTGGEEPSSLYMDAKNEYIYATLKGGKPVRFKLAGDKKESLPISAKLNIEFKEELNQIFEEAWKALDQQFYDPNFHGQDFDALKATYKPLAMKASTREDFNTVFNQMLGQINASHMGLYRGDLRKDVQSTTTGLIGVELKPVTDGVQVIGKLPQMPADREISTISVGETITTVNGTPINSGVNYYDLMNNTADERVLLTVKNTSGQNREVEIRPVSSNSNARYKAWVQEKKKLVDEYSNGQLGYIHIQAMGWASFERFERELAAAGYGKKGIVIDVRFNGGGWTTDHLMAILNVKQHAYTIPRGATESLDNNKEFTDYYPYSERLPLPAWTKPSITLCNESSYSNAEIFAHAYKHLGIGTLVGKPTFGAVISTSGRGLIDGSWIRLPYRAWYVKATGENMELGPALPDIVLDNAPDERSRNEDSQLKKATEQLLKEIK